MLTQAAARRAGAAGQHGVIEAVGRGGVAAVRGPEAVREVAEPIMALMATGAYPTMVEMATTYHLQPVYDFADEFEFGLDLALDALEQRRH
jgi:hypothetical protein